MTENRLIKKPEISNNFEKSLKLYKNILPRELVKAAIKAKKNTDQTEFKKHEGDINLFITRYNEKIHNPKLIAGEQTLRRYTLKENGEMVLTNFRAFIFSKEGIGFPVGLHVSDTVVTEKISKSSRTSSSQRISRTYGNLVFVFDGKRVLCFNNIRDPQGVKNLIQTFKKQPISV
ncbi:MAG: hypothetical protein ABSA79_03015 [Candidatus Bathyarchaeia archaeon]|jgi:hypothetical protein